MFLSKNDYLLSDGRNTNICKTLAKTPQNLNTLLNPLYININIYIGVEGFGVLQGLYNHNARVCACEGFQGF